MSNIKPEQKYLLFEEHCSWLCLKEENISTSGNKILDLFIEQF